MHHLYENIAYLRGLAEGLELAEGKKGKIYMAIIDTLDDMATAINMLDEDIEDLDEYVDAIDEDLMDLEDDYMSDIYEDDYEDFDDFEYCELECPECGEIIYTDEPFFSDFQEGDQTVICESCGAEVDASLCNVELDDYTLADDDFDEAALDIEEGSSTEDVQQSEDQEDNVSAED